MIKNKLYFFVLVVFLSSLLLPSKADDSIEFLTLKNNKVNLRQGPSFKHPVKLIYKKKYLPVIIINKIETWREIKDHQSNSGWIHVSQLSKRKSGINIEKNSIIYKKPTIYSKPIAKLDLGRLVLIEKCKSQWCKIKSGGYIGWVNKNTLWGNI